MLIFKLPDIENFYTVNNSSNVNVSFVSFDKNQTIDFKGNIEEISKEKILESAFIPKSKSNYTELGKETQDSYSLKINQAKEFIDKNELKKMVLSRRKLLMYCNVSAEGKLDLNQSFLKFCEIYPNAFCYLFEKNNETWMGGFSEILGKFDKTSNRFETMSLAGTLPLDEDWTEKEIEEQKAVTDYIHQTLKRYSTNLKISSTEDLISGNIKHLKTDFSAEIVPDMLDKIISELHPTPAVCGFPKDICLQGIRSIEHFNRELYAGYIRIETEETIYYFVNLRCAKFFKNYAFLSVGGGITPKSDPEKEWQETELKSLAIQNSLVFS